MWIQNPTSLPIFRQCSQVPCFCCPVIGAPTHMIDDHGYSSCQRPYGLVRDSSFTSCITSVVINSGRSKPLLTSTFCSASDYSSHFHLSSRRRSLALSVRCLSHLNNGPSIAPTSCDPSRAYHGSTISYLHIPQHISTSVLVLKIKINPIYHTPPDPSVQELEDGITRGAEVDVPLFPWTELTANVRVINN